jgi:hypothetical protein
MRRTTVFGYNMQKQIARRRLIVAVYALLALLLVAGWFLDHLHVSGFYIYFAGYFLSYFVLGGYGPRGLIKPFHGRGPRTQPMPSNLVELELRYYGNLPAADPDEYRNDERELQRRDRVHYQAYQAICVLLAGIWLLATWTLHPPRFMPAGLLPVLLYFIVLPAILLAITLPQAILLWTEPDLATETEDDSASLHPAPQHSP